VANLTALTVCAAARDRPAHVIGLSQVLFRYLDAGRYAEAITIHARANEAAELVGDAASQVQALNGLATVLWHRGDDDSASCHLRQALELARAHAGLGRAHHALGEVPLARQHSEQALAIYTGLDLPQALDVRTLLASLDRLRLP
jgi:tetratricopeptide (TPR) repeat protein